MIRRLIDALGPVAAVPFAAPVALFGLDRLVAGRVGQGILFLVIAAGMLALPRFIPGPTDVATEATREVVGDEED